MVSGWKRDFPRFQSLLDIGVLESAPYLVHAGPIECILRIMANVPAPHLNISITTEGRYVLVRHEGIHRISRGHLFGWLGVLAGFGSLLLGLLR